MQLKICIRHGDECRAHNLSQRQQKQQQQRKIPSTIISCGFNVRHACNERIEIEKDVKQHRPAIHVDETMKLCTHQRLYSITMSRSIWHVPILIRSLVLIVRISLERTICGQMVN